MIRMSCMECGSMFPVESHGVGKDRYRCRPCRHSNTSSTKPYIKIECGRWVAQTYKHHLATDLRAASEFVQRKNIREGRYPGAIEV